MTNWRQKLRLAVFLVIAITSAVMLLVTNYTAGWTRVVIVSDSSYIKNQDLHDSSLESTANVGNMGDVHQPPLKTIVSVTRTFWNMSEMNDFTTCQYSNCRLWASSNRSDIANAEVLLFQFNYIRRHKLPKVKWRKRSKQYWVVFSWESPVGYASFKWTSETNGKFNATLTYRTDSELYMPFGRTIPRDDKSAVNWSLLDKKSKGAFVYVSYCNTISFNRMAVIAQLKKYIDVDVFGKCTGKRPCKDKVDNDRCMAKAHSKYRFYLSIENSLCKDYITEKFWDRLKSPGLFIPVALGGLSLQEYERAAPPNSYIHLYNFTSIRSLGMYLRHLVSNKDMYKRYHDWRQRYDIENGKNFCKLCQLANEKPQIQPLADVTTWWNDPSQCRTYKSNELS